jgi:hypothetical protein
MGPPYNDKESCPVSFVRFSCAASLGEMLEFTEELNEV